MSGEKVMKDEKVMNGEKAQKNKNAKHQREEAAGERFLENVVSFTKRQAMLPVALALCFILKKLF